MLIAKVFISREGKERWGRGKNTFEIVKMNIRNGKGSCGRRAIARTTTPINVDRNRVGNRRKDKVVICNVLHKSEVVWVGFNLCPCVAIVHCYILQ